MTTTATKSAAATAGPRMATMSPAIAAASATTTTTTKDTEDIAPPPPIGWIPICPTVFPLQTAAANDDDDTQAIWWPVVVYPTFGRLQQDGAAWKWQDTMLLLNQWMVQSSKAKNHHQQKDKPVICKVLGMEQPYILIVDPAVLHSDPPVFPMKGYGLPPTPTSTSIHKDVFCAYHVAIHQGAQQVQPSSLLLQEEEDHHILEWARELWEQGTSSSSSAPQEEEEESILQEQDPSIHQEEASIHQEEDASIQEPEQESMQEPLQEESIQQEDDLEQEESIHQEEPDSPNIMRRRPMQDAPSVSLISMDESTTILAAEQQSWTPPAISSTLLSRTAPWPRVWEILQGHGYFVRRIRYNNNMQQYGHASRPTVALATSLTDWQAWVAHTYGWRTASRTSQRQTTCTASTSTTTTATTASWTVQSVLKAFKEDYGGKHLPSSNPLQDWWYVFQHAQATDKRTWTQGVDYVASIPDLVEWMHQQQEKNAMEGQDSHQPVNTQEPVGADTPNQEKEQGEDEAVPEQKDAMEEEDVEEIKVSNPSKPVKKKPPVSKGKAPKARSTKKSATFKKGATDNNAFMVVPPDQVGVTCDDPSTNEAPWVHASTNGVWGIVSHQLGCTHSCGKYYLPPSDNNDDQHTSKQQPTFASVDDLVAHFATAGIPHVDRLSTQERDFLEGVVRRSKVRRGASAWKATRLLTDVQALSLLQPVLVLEEKSNKKQWTYTLANFCSFQSLAGFRAWLRSVPDLGIPTDSRRRRGRPWQDAHRLALQLWASESSVPLPVYGSAVVEEAYLEHLQNLPPSTQEDTLWEAWSKRKEQIAAAKGSSARKRPPAKAAKRSKKEQAGATSPVAKKSKTEAASNHSLESPASSLHSDSSSVQSEHPLWVRLQQVEGLQFLSSMWPLLQRIGFSYTSGQGYMLPGSKPYDAELMPRFSSDLEMRRYLCSEGIPLWEHRKEALDQDEQEQVILWVMYANVPVHIPPGMWELVVRSHVSQVALEDEQARQWLTEAGFVQKGLAWFVPSVAGQLVSRKADDWIEHVHYFASLSHLRTHLRATFDWMVFWQTDHGAKRRRKTSSEKPALDPAREFLLRVWAAESDEDLRTFVLPPLEEEDDDEDDDDMDSHEDAQALDNFKTPLQDMEAGGSLTIDPMIDVDADDETPSPNRPQLLFSAPKEPTAEDTHFLSQIIQDNGNDGLSQDY